MDFDPRRSFERSVQQFMLTEANTGIVFASIALDALADEKRQRNLLNAQKAYDTLTRFWTKYPPRDAAVQLRLLGRIAELRRLLVQLGQMSEEA